MPKRVKFDDYLRPNITQINAGASQSAFVDDIGRLFMCGKGEFGQLGTGQYENELAPYYMSKIPEKIQEVACGEEHTLALTKNGQIFGMGSNARGELGIGHSSRGSNLPILLEELNFVKIVKIRAGLFSAAFSQDNQLYLWGSGPFGEFYTPHRVKSVQQIDLLDFQVGRGGFIVVLSRSGSVYTWGNNEMGQLGQGDTQLRSVPQRVESIENKKVTSIACGKDFVVTLGLTLPMKEA